MTVALLIRESLESYRHSAAEKNITLKAALANPSGAIQFDRDRIAQILSNLISNAVKFTPEGGAVTLKTEQTENEIKVSVSDTGPGIPEAETSRVFEKFAQLRNKDRHGLGLGLYISKTLVESHNGKLWVVSQPGKGSTFCFTLPKQQPGAVHFENDKTLTGLGSNA